MLNIYKHSIYVSLFALALSACNGNKEQEAENVNQDSCLMTPQLRGIIRTDTLLIKDISQEIELTGSVSYNQDEIYNYQSLVSGVIQKVNFKLGDFVQKGQVLAEVRTTEFNDQKSELLKAKSELKLAKRKLESTKNLHADGVASDRDLIEAQNEVSYAEIEIERIQETLKLQGGNIERGILTIKAPATGYIVQKKITVGTQIDAGEDELFTLSNLKKVWVQANVFPNQLESVKVGQAVEIITTAYPDKVFYGKIDRLSNVFDEEERVLKAIIEIDNADLRLKPSMMVGVHIYKPAGGTALAIPKDAVLFENNSYKVVIDKGDCDVQAVQVEPIGKDRRYYFVNSQLLKEGDRVITQNQLLIYNQIKDR
ncbi:efflux RND transporter periplasmic adaptor subunit [Pseudopedobacter beijingensis]|uniref:Efflux RND transporter periplasmic adaptor subunit n=1 Tax=Pseudopedobacter beijingensis TaxID=1207056 RepID=A0ABW4IDU1_9SPHI